MNNNVLGINLGTEEVFEPQKRNITKEYGGIPNLKAQVMNKAKETANKCKLLAEQYKGFLNDNKVLAEQLKMTTDTLRKCLEKLGAVEQDYDGVMSKIKNIRNNSDSRMKQIQEQSQKDKEDNERKRKELEDEFERKRQEDNQKFEEDKRTRDEESKRLLEEQKQEEQRHSEQQRQDKERALAQAKQEADENARKAKEVAEQEMANSSQECKDKLGKMKQEMDTLIENHKLKLQEQHDVGEALLKEKEQMFEKNKQELIEKNDTQMKDVEEKHKQQLAVEQQKLKVVDELKLKQANDKCEKEKQDLLNEIGEVMQKMGDIEVAADQGAKIKIDEIKDVVEKTCDKINSLEQKVKASASDTPTLRRGSTVSFDDEHKSGNNNDLTLPNMTNVPADFKLDKTRPKKADVWKVDGRENWYNKDFKGFQHWYTMFGKNGRPARLVLLDGNLGGENPYGENTDFAIFSKQFYNNILKWRSKTPERMAKFTEQLYQAHNLMLKIAKEEDPNADIRSERSAVWLDIYRKLRRWLAHYYEDYIKSNLDIPGSEEYRQWLYNLYSKGTFKDIPKNKMVGGSKGGMKSIAEVEKKIVMSKCTHPNPKSDCHNTVAQESQGECSSFGYNRTTKGSDCVWEDPLTRSNATGGKKNKKKKKKQKGGYRYGVKLNMKRTLKTREKTQRMKTFKKKKRRKKRSRKRRKFKMSKKKRR